MPGGAGTVADQHSTAGQDMTEPQEPKEPPCPDQQYTEWIEARLWQHFCPVKKTYIDVQGECNWCGKKGEE